MGIIFKTNIHINIRCFPLFFFEQEVSLTEAFIDQPPAGCHLKNMLKVPFKRGQASSRQIGEMLQVPVELVVLIHVSLQVNFTGFLEIKQDVL
ncbi:MAG: hypothetical protein JWR05_969 [Mucilaginibacter sp.]|nr:hypothetical protein [Mucilaginibacter sp.]